jgi:methionyl-tRNA formyltransferase
VIFFRPRRISHFGYRHDALRIIFMGTAELSCASLEKLLRAMKNFSVVAVVTQPDKPKGRELKLTPSPVKILAEKLTLPVLQPRKRAMKNSFRTARIETRLDGRRRLRTNFAAKHFGLPRFGCLNVHTSLLPKYRGAAPIQWAIADGETETGVTIMKMDAGLDTGPVLSMRRTPILPADDSQSFTTGWRNLARNCWLKRFQITSPGKLCRSRSQRKAQLTPRK